MRNESPRWFLGAAAGWIAGAIMILGGLVAGSAMLQVALGRAADDRTIWFAAATAAAGAFVFLGRRVMRRATDRAAARLAADQEAQVDAKPLPARDETTSLESWRRQEVKRYGRQE